MIHRRSRLLFLRSRFLFFAVLLIVIFGGQPSQAAKNVILMVADGAGHNAWLAASMYHGKVGQQVYDQTDWVRLSACTYPLHRKIVPTGDNRQDPALVYNPQKAWIAAPESDNSGIFAGYAYLTSACTDSAAAGTAMATGQKTYDTAINWSNEDKPMLGKTIAEIAKAAGKSAGVVTSVPWSHATPATLGGAHKINRNHYSQIAKEMLGSSWLSVIMGAGNPDFDNDGKPLPATKKHDYQPVGGEDTWKALKAGKLPWKLIEKREDFEALTSGPTPPKVLGTAQVASTLQENRRRIALSGEKNRSIGATAPASQQSGPPEPFAVPMNKNVPSLAVMAKAAINCLDDNPQGFYLMIEGGAVDWANHANLPDRMIEEQTDFIKAVETVVAWIESHGGWDDTLLILTADHETGLLWGPNSAKVAFQPLQDRGEGKMPGMKYNGHGHSNSLVPLYARGPGSQRFAMLTKGKDTKAAACWNYSGQYVENTDIFAVMKAETVEEAKP